MELPPIAFDPDQSESNTEAEAPEVGTIAFDVRKWQTIVPGSRELAGLATQETSMQEQKT